MKRDLVSLESLTTEDINNILDLAARLKKDRSHLDDQLRRKTIGLVFQKPSNRTRMSFEVGVHQLGGNCVYMGPEEINLGVRESTEDVSKTLSRYVDGIVARTFTHKDVLDLAEHATVPIINGLSDLYHPCQALADIFTIQEKFGSLKGLTVAYIGDGNNVCHSLMLGCAKLGINIHIACPKGFEPNKDIIEKAGVFANKTGCTIHITDSPKDAIHHNDNRANVVYTDVWTSMGQEQEKKKRLKKFKKYQINEELVKEASGDYIFMHCLPAHRGEEVTADIIDGKHSVVFDQAENRLHVQKAILIILIRTHQKKETEAS